MELAVQTWTHWEKKIDDELGPIYRQVFPQGAKPARLLQQESQERQARRTGGGRS